MRFDIPMGSDEWNKMGVTRGDPSLMTLVGIAEGEVLEALETGGPAAMASVLEQSQLPMPLVLMSVGALVRDGLVRATKSREHVRLESIT